MRYPVTQFDTSVCNGDNVFQACTVFENNFEVSPKQLVRPWDGRIVAFDQRTDKFFFCKTYPRQGQK